jgi:hypothetical protein
MKRQQVAIVKSSSLITWGVSAVDFYIKQNPHRLGAQTMENSSWMTGYR